MGKVLAEYDLELKRLENGLHDKGTETKDRVKW